LVKSLRFVEFRPRRGRGRIGFSFPFARLNYCSPTQAPAPLLSPRQLRVGFRWAGRRFLFKSVTNPALHNKTEKSEATQVPSDKKSSQHIEIQGTLRYADSINTNKPNNEIRVKDQSGFSHKIKVPVELMDDIVRPYWNNEVIIKGMRKQKNGIITLVSIEAVTD